MKKIILLCFILSSVVALVSFSSKNTDSLLKSPVEFKKEKISAVFSHGFWDYACQVNNYKDFFSFSMNSFSYPDAKNDKIHLSKANLAQENDIQALQNAVKKHDANVLMGLSRGASTIITFLATHKVAGLKAVILESPFDCMENVAKALICKRLHLGWIPGLARFAAYTIPWILREYKRDGIKPIDVIHNIPKDLPILLICSLEDSLIPVSSTIALYNRLCQTGHKKAHLLILDYGKHSKLVIGPDYQRYKEVCHAFCKEYGLSYDKQLAQAGKYEYARCKSVS
ncbi:hypothetical protein KAH94_02680 [bacterium]|nr:hypothetical protein [bacterium]